MNFLDYVSTGVKNIIKGYIGLSLEKTYHDIGKFCCENRGCGCTFNILAIRGDKIMSACQNNTIKIWEIVDGKFDIEDIVLKQVLGIPIKNYWDRSDIKLVEENTKFGHIGIVRGVIFLGGN